MAPLDLPYAVQLEMEWEEACVAAVKAGLPLPPPPPPPPPPPVPLLVGFDWPPNIPLILPGEPGSPENPIEID